MSDNKYIIENTINENLSIEHLCNMCGEIWVDRIVKSNCINGCKTKGWATNAPDYAEYCPDCKEKGLTTILIDLEFGHDQILKNAYCDVCDKILVDDEYEPTHLKIIEWSCVGIILAVLGTFIYAAVASYFGG